jgi:hypothetical protein
MICLHEQTLEDIHIHSRQDRQTADTSLACVCHRLSPQYYESQILIDLVATYVLLLAWFLHSSALKMEALGSCETYCHVSGVCVTNKTGFFIWWSNLLDLYKTGYNSSQFPIWQCLLLPTGHSTGTVLTSSWTPFYSLVLLQFSFSFATDCALL